MIKQEGYPTAAGVEAAIKAAAKAASSKDPSLTVSDRIALESFHRFLSRIFAEGATSEWVLKGGTGILARIPAARATHDVDLFHSGFSLDEALRDLRRLAAIDLHDHFRFEYAGYRPSIDGEAQPYTEGYRVSFTIFVGASERGSLNVDLAAGAGLTVDVTTAAPVSALNLPRLVSNPYRLYPVVDQIADKVCATLADYSGRPSTREKDLVDLVVFATTHDIDGDALILALSTEIKRRRLPHPERFAVPTSWGQGYARLARRVSACAEHRIIAAALVTVSRLIDPGLTGKSAGRTWSHQALRWEGGGST